MQTEDGAAKEVPLEYDDRLMQRAFDQARKALGEGEVPIGCVFSVDGAVVAEVTFQIISTLHVDHSYIWVL